ncbi:MAG: phospholipid/cholesterol/gamma-HCH transport system substrate-binding protein [Verrucomicrobiota bacterium]|jgi:ABC-type transporter Mla subunit MlaD
MQLQRNEILTGLLVLVTVAVLTGILILLGAPGLFKPLVTYKIYMDNAAGIKLGAPVLLAGRKIGQVEKLYSPVSKEDAVRAEASAEALRAADAGATPTPSPKPNATPTPVETKPKYEARIDVRVDKDAGVYKDAKARLITLGLLGETAIDFTQGRESSGRANDGEMFAGERVPDFGESISKMLDIVKPVATEATATLKELQTTTQNLSRITDENSQLNMGLAQFRTFVENLTSLTARDSSLSIALKNIEKISTDLSSNDNITITLQNFRESSDKLKGIMADLGQLGPDLKESGANVKELTRTVKTQPWRLIWPSTKKYPQDEQPAASDTITVRKPAKTQRRSSPTPPPRTR